MRLPEQFEPRMCCLGSALHDPIRGAQIGRKSWSGQVHTFPKYAYTRCVYVYAYFCFSFIYRGRCDGHPGAPVWPKNAGSLSAYNLRICVYTVCLCICIFSIFMRIAGYPREGSGGRSGGVGGRNVKMRRIFVLAMCARDCGHIMFCDSESSFLTQSTNRIKKLRFWPILLEELKVNTRMTKHRYRTKSKVKIVQCVISDRKVLIAKNRLSSRTMQNEADVRKPCVSGPSY